MEKKKSRKFLIFHCVLLSNESFNLNLGIESEVPMAGVCLVSKGFYQKISYLNKVWCQGHLQEQRHFHLLLTLQRWSLNPGSLQSLQCYPGPSVVQPAGPSEPSSPGCVHHRCCKVTGWNGDRDVMAGLLRVRWPGEVRWAFRIRLATTSLALGGWADFTCL